VIYEVLCLVAKLIELLNTFIDSVECSISDNFILTMALSDASTVSCCLQTILHLFEHVFRSKSLPSTGRLQAYWQDWNPT
jgi:hypothetical protein